MGGGEREKEGLHFLLSDRDFWGERCLKGGEKKT